MTESTGPRAGIMIAATKRLESGRIIALCSVGNDFNLAVERRRAGERYRPSRIGLLVGLSAKLVIGASTFGFHSKGRRIFTWYGSSFLSDMNSFVRIFCQIDGSFASIIYIYSTVKARTYRESLETTESMESQRARTSTEEVLVEVLAERLYVLGESECRYNIAQWKCVQITRSLDLIS